MASIEVSLSTTPRRKKAPSTTTTPVPSLFGGQAEEPAPDLLTVQGSKGPLWTRSPQQRTSGLAEKERKAAQDRLQRLKSELDSKRLAIKNIKLALDTIDISDNIDVRIQQAELEYQLGREELNLLSIMEESRNLQVLLEECNGQQQTIFSYIGNSAVSLYGVELMYDPKSPQFGVSQRDEGGVLVEWAVDSSGLSKGDRLLEVNGKLVSRQDEVARLLQVSPHPAQVVVMRRQDQLMSHLRAELSQVKEKAGEADSFRRDNLRLTHRISYLEEQVAELLERARETKPKAMPQVFQKGSQVALVANLPGLEKTESSLPQSKSKSHYDEVRSAKSVDLLEKPKRKKELPVTRSTHSLDVECRRQQRILGDGHLSGDSRQRHIREARSSLFTFLDRGKYDCDSEPTLDCGSESSVRGGQRREKPRPVPPKKPVRLSLSRATSLQSVDGSEKKALKRSHKGEAPPVPQPQVRSGSTQTNSKSDHRVIGHINGQQEQGNSTHHANGQLDHHRMGLEHRGISHSTGQSDHRGVSHSNGQSDHRGTTHINGQFDHRSSNHNNVQLEHRGTTHNNSHLEHRGSVHNNGHLEHRGMNHSNGQLDHRVTSHTNGHINIHIKSHNGHPNSMSNSNPHGLTMHYTHSETKWC